MSDRVDEKSQKETLETHQFLAILSWISVAILVINVSYFVGEEVGGIWYRSSGDAVALFNGWWIGIIKAMPTILIAWAIGEFALMFGRYSEGDVFSERNVKALKAGADSLIWAAIWSAFIAPNLLNWLGGEYNGLGMDFRDLALAVGMMGLSLHGLALVFRDAVAIKQDNDEII